MEDKQFNRDATRNSEGIIRQSQLERAIQIFQLMEIKPSLRELLRLSQILTDFQYTWNLNHYEIIKFEKHFKQETSKSLIDSIPHVEADKPLTKRDKAPSQFQLASAKENKGKA